METIQISLEALCQLLKKDNGEISAALKDGENLKPQDVIDAYVRDTHSERMNAERRDARDEGHGRGKREALTVKGDEIRERFGLKAKTIDAMFEEMKDLKDPPPDMTPDSVRKSEIYKTDVGKLNATIQQLQTEKSDISKKYKKRATMSKIKDAAAAIFADNNFVLPEDLKIRANIESTIFNALTTDGFFINLNDAGEFVVTDSEGQQKMDPNTVKPITFEERFISVASGYLPTSKSDSRKSPMNSNDGKGGAGSGGSGGSYSFTMPEDGNAYFEAMTNMKDAEERKAYKEFYIANGGE